MNSGNYIVFCFLVVVLMVSFNAYSDINSNDLDSDESDLAMMSLEELMDIQIVTSVSKREQKITEAPAAIYVITQEDIRRSGATSIAEALRMAPGVNVGRINSSEWAISVRGFQEQLASKLLVLIDGRSVYTPAFSGIYWDIQDLMLEDIDRIEIIRGPGATLWGANAVNGVINIITKSSKNTQGGLLYGGAGNEEQGFGGLRYGGKVNDVYYRLYAKYFQRDEFSSDRTDIEATYNSNKTKDDWDVMRGGFRLDWEDDGDNSLTFQGDIYDGDKDMLGCYPQLEINPLLPPGLDSGYYYQYYEEMHGFVRGGNLLGRWSHKFSDTSEFTMQLYYDRNERKTVNTYELIETYDFDSQFSFSLTDRHNIILGLGYRYITDEFDVVKQIVIDPDNRDVDLFSFFIQDEITLIEEKLKLTLGSKFEHNDYTGFEIQPSARIMFTPHENHQSLGFGFLCCKNSQSFCKMIVLANEVRTIQPNYSLSGISWMVLSWLLGNEDIESEELTAYEAWI